MKTSRFLIILSLLAFCLACEESPSPYPDSIRLLTNNGIKKWTTVSIQYPNKVEGLDCEEDDILTLNIFDPAFDSGKGASTYALHEGYIPCSDSYLSESGSWRLNNTQTRLIFTYGEAENRVNSLLDILELSDRKLILRQRKENYSDLAVTIKTFTFESL